MNAGVTLGGRIEAKNPMSFRYLLPESSPAIFTVAGTLNVDST